MKTCRFDALVAVAEAGVFP